LHFGVVFASERRWYTCERPDILKDVVRHHTKLEPRYCFCPFVPKAWIPPLLTDTSSTRVTERGAQHAFDWFAFSVGVGNRI